MRLLVVRCGRVSGLVRLAIPLFLWVGAFGATAIAAPDQASATEPPVAAYPFDEGAGEVAHDSVGELDGTLLGAQWTPGKFGPALQFNANESDQVTVPSSPALDLSEAFTVAAWVRPSKYLHFAPIVLKEAGTYFSYALEEGPKAGVPAGFISPEGTVEEVIEASEPLPLKTWSYLAFTFDGEDMRLYVNGNLEATAPTPTPQSGEGALQIGNSNLFESAFAGKIDEVRIYDRALSLEEIHTDEETPLGTTEGSEGEGEEEAGEGCSRPAIGVSGAAIEPETPGVDLEVEGRPASEPCHVESAIKKIVVKIDEETVESEERDCTEPEFFCVPRYMFRSFQLPYEKVVGTHTIEVEAEDQFGETATVSKWSETTPAEGTIASIPPEAEDSKESGGCKTPKNRWSKYRIRGHTLIGTPCADIIPHHPGVKVYLGENGDDTIRGGGGAETFRGGAGEDTIFAGRGNDRVFGGADDDHLDGGTGDDHVLGQGGNDTLIGGPAPRRYEEARAMT